MRVFFQIIKGGNDDFLDWPFSGKVKIKFIDQELIQSKPHAYKKRIEMCLDPAENTVYFSKPVTDKNAPWSFQFSTVQFQRGKWPVTYETFVHVNVFPPY